MREAFLIADIGGTSSRWGRIGHDGAIAAWTEALPGFNPATGDGATFARAVRAHFQAEAPRLIACKAVAIYGAGCGHEVRRERMRGVIAEVFPEAAIDVRSDLLGAARAVYGDGSGIVLILGTGMNAGRYDGVRLDLPMPSLGYLLGDEGSGADLGRHLLNAVYYGRTGPATLERLFPNGVPDLAHTLERLHGSSSPAQELASHAARLAGALDDPFVLGILADRFGVLAGSLQRFFGAGQVAEVRAVGSIAHHFQVPLRQALEQHGFALTDVLRDPLDGLLRYHARREH